MKRILKQALMIFTVCVIAPSTFAEPAAAMPADHQAMPTGTANRLYGKVVKTMDATSYTYVQVDTGKEKYWVAGPKAVLKKGAMVAFDTQMPFNDFESKTLNKKFKVIYFVNSLVTDQPGKTTAPASNPHANITKSDKAQSLKGIVKAKDGKTVAEVFKQKQGLSGKAVRVRGKVVKYTPKVMGRNWLHIQDSSGMKKLVVTTEQEVTKGALVVVNGIVAVDQDLGYGYTYEVILERALVTVE